MEWKEGMRKKWERGKRQQNGGERCESQTSLDFA